MAKKGSSIIKYTAINTAKGIDKEIAAVAASANTLKERIQNLAIAIIQHIHKHGDYTKAQLLVDSLGDGVRKQGLVKFFKLFAHLHVEAGSSAFSGFGDGTLPHSEAAKRIKDSFNTAKATWWCETIKREDAFAGFDINEKLRRLAKELASQRKRSESASPENRAKIILDVDDKVLELFLNHANLNIVGIED